MAGHDIPSTIANRIVKLDDGERQLMHMPPPPEVRNSALVKWAYEAREAAQIAVSLAKTQFVPASMQGKPHDITAAILAGHELGLRPMAALRSMDIIHGTPALRAHAMRGLLQSHGHKMRVVEASPTRVVMEGQRCLALPGWQPTWDEPQTVEWTIERAADLGLTNKAEWKKQPQTMLIARATGELARLIAADVLFAMPYAAEEIEREPELAEPLTIAELTQPPSTPRKRRPGGVIKSEPFTEGPLVDQELPLDSVRAAEDQELAASFVDVADPERDPDDWPEVATPPDAS